MVRRTNSRETLAQFIKKRSRSARLIVTSGDRAVESGGPIGESRAALGALQRPYLNELALRIVLVRGDDRSIPESLMSEFRNRLEVREPAFNRANVAVRTGRATLKHI